MADRGAIRGMDVLECCFSKFSIGEFLRVYQKGTNFPRILRARLGGRFALSLVE
jgi:hypothetical protein